MTAVRQCMECLGSIPDTKRRDSLFCSQTCAKRARNRRARVKKGVNVRPATMRCLTCQQALDGSWGRQYCSRACVEKARRARPWDRDQRLQSQYGIDRPSFDRMLASQGGCAICGTHEPDGRGWHVDHDHACCPGIRSCGTCVRGILCASCNTGLGLFADDPDRLLAAATYLLRRADVLAFVD